MSTPAFEAAWQACPEGQPPKTRSVKLGRGTNFLIFGELLRCACRAMVPSCVNGRLARRCLCELFNARHESGADGSIPGKRIPSFPSVAHQLAFPFTCL
jgi:hypothetical protein